MVDSEEPPDPSEAVTFKIKLERSFSRLLVIAERVGRGRVLAAAELALEALAAGAVAAGFNLPLSAAAMWTLMHTKRYSIISVDLGNPFGVPVFGSLRQILVFRLTIIAYDNHPYGKLFGRRGLADG